MNENDKPIPWVAAMDGTQILAVQHGCGPQPVNCFIDEYRNWACPRCYEVYGAAVPLVGWLGVPIAEKSGS